MSPSTCGRILLVTGTDTEVGKTFTAAALAVALRRLGRSVLAIKPVESGGEQQPDGQQDGQLLAQASGQRWPLAALTRLQAPLAPPIAAQLEGATLQPHAWIEQVRAWAPQADWTLLEGAGGLLSPLTWDHTALDLARALDARALVVAANRLGCINHTLMTCALLRAAHVTPLAVILNDAQDAQDASAPWNEQALRRLLEGAAFGSPALFYAPRASSWQEHSLPMEQVAAHLLRVWP